MEQTTVGLACLKDAAALMSISIEYAVCDMRPESAIRCIAKGKSFSMETAAMSVSRGVTMAHATNMATLEGMRAVCVLEESNRIVP